MRKPSPRSPWLLLTALCGLPMATAFAQTSQPQAGPQTPAPDFSLEEAKDDDSYRDPLDTRDAAGRPVPAGGQRSTEAPSAPTPTPHTAAYAVGDRLLWGGDLSFDVRIEDAGTGGGAGAGLLLRARTPEREGLFVQAEAGLAHDDEGVKMKELFLGSRMGTGELRAGLQKKQLGRYEQLDDRDRLAVARPVVYDSLEEFDYAAREIRVGLVDARRDAPSPPFDGQAGSGQQGYDYHLSFGSGSATNFNLLGFVGELAPDAPLQYGVWGLLQGQRYRSKREPVWSAAAFTGAQSPLFSWAIEAVAGKDPFETDWERTFGNNATQVVFWSMSAEAGFHALHGTGWRLSPFLLGSYFVPRQSRSKQNTVQGIAGVRWDRGPLRVAVELDIRGTSKQDKDERSWKTSRGRLQAAYGF